MKSIVLLSGPVAVGKSEATEQLVRRYGAVAISTSSMLRTQLGGKPSRFDLQAAGGDRDKNTGGRWVAQALAQAEVDREDIRRAEVVVLDSVRQMSQVDGVRQAFGGSRQVIHVHLTAPIEILARRYRMRRMKKGEPAHYHEVRRDPIEARVDELAGPADIVIDSRYLGPDDASVRIAARLGSGDRSTRNVDVIVGGQYGSEGKGHIVAYLAREYDLLVRVGGPNAGHSVIYSGGKYVHHLLPSGTRVSTAKLLIAPGAVLDAAKLLVEINECEVEPDRLAIDPAAVMITDEHKAREEELAKRIGSTKQGTGAATADRVMRVDGLVRAGDVPELRAFLQPAADVLADAYATRKKVLLEGTQGTMLSLYHGTFPYVTSRDTTVAGCLAEAGIPPTRVRRTIIVLRTYPIRVQSPDGATSGPMGRKGMELSWAEIARRSGLPVKKLRRAERTSTTDRQRRVAEFDWQLLERTASLNGPTDIALTFADYLSVKNRDARRFEQLTPETIRFVEEVETVAAAPVSLISTRFHERSIIDRRSW